MENSTKCNNCTRGTSNNSRSNHKAKHIPISTNKKRLNVYFPNKTNYIHPSERQLIYKNTIEKILLLLYEKQKIFLRVTQSCSPPRGSIGLWADSLAQRNRLVDNCPADSRT